MSLVSIVVPVYNSSKYLDRCILSLSGQTLRDIEIICVDDGSKDDSVELLEMYASQDSRIKIIRHDSNMGLLKTRGDGVRAASGRYTMFVDADDDLSLDACLELTALMDESNADMLQFGTEVVASKGVDDDLKEFFVNFLKPCTERLTGSEIFKAQFSWKFSWHIWDKIYKTDLCRKAYASAGEDYLIFSDDLYLAFFLTYYSELCIGVEKDYYRYHLGCGYTGGPIDEMKKLETCCKNSWFLYKCIDFLKENGIWKKYKHYCFTAPLLQLDHCLTLWSQISDAEYREKGKELIIEYWDNDLFHDRLYGYFDSIGATGKPCNQHVGAKQLLFRTKLSLKEVGFKETLVRIKTYLCRDKVKHIVPNAIIASIENPEIRVVSFDLFDTLVARPSIDPVNIFSLVDCQGFLTKSEFVSLRIFSDGESLKIFGPKANIRNAYSVMGEITSIPRSVLEGMMECELSLEKNLLRPRADMKRIFNLAVSSGKKVIITTDTYFERDFVEDLVHGCGYKGVDCFYVSSEIGMRKDDGALFNKILSDYSIESKELLHIGDNPDSDGSVPASKGIHVANCRKIKDYLTDSYYGRYTGFLKNEYGNNFLLGTFAAMRFEKNKNTAHPWNDAYELGLFMGPTLLSFTKWMVEQVREKGSGKMLLCYRDGFLIEKMMDIYSKYVDVDFDYEEIHLPRIVRHFFYVSDGGLLRSLTELGVSPSMTLSDFIRYRVFEEDPERYKKVLKLFLDCGYSSDTERVGDLSRVLPIVESLDVYFRQNCTERMESVKRYCELKIHEGDMVFDVGYRGSVHSFIEKHLGLHCPEIQLFANTGMHLNPSKDVTSYITYPTKIAIDCTILELIYENVISSQEPELLNIRMEDGEYEYVYNERGNTTNKNITMVQQGVLDYVEYTLSVLKEKVTQIHFDHDIEWLAMADFLRCPVSKKSASVIRSLYRPDSSQIVGGEGSNLFDYWYNCRF